MKLDDYATKADGSSVKVKNLEWIAVVVLAFATGIGFGTYSTEKAEPVLAAPLGIDFCSLAINQDYLVGARIQTTSKMSLGIEVGCLKASPAPTACLCLERRTMTDAGRRFSQHTITIPPVPLPSSRFKLKEPLVGGGDWFVGFMTGTSRSRMQPTDPRWLP